ncbi:MAG: hypothetical protein LQ342_000366 [Letrouitia transgressa]|nr:MAG: hypothetical protein LQ342_000366 [Letrouitia transgressa]
MTANESIAGQAGGSNAILEGSRRAWQTPGRGDGAFETIGNSRQRVRGMVVYQATEKDCVGEDGAGQAECVICFEEFEAGVDMVQVGAAVIYCLFAAGIVFGYAALKPVLVQERVYRKYCAAGKGFPEETCYEQEIRLNLMFTVAAVSTNVCALPVGTILDKYGPRVSGVIGSVLLALGSLLFAFAARIPFDALLTGAFDSSSAVFLFYRLIYAASQRTFTPQKFFLVYLIVPFSILIIQLCLMPKNSYKTVGELVNHAQNPTNGEDTMDHRIENEDQLNQVREERRAHRENVISEITSLLGDKGKQGGKQHQQQERKKRISGVWGALHGYSAAQQVKSPWFILITLFTVVQMTRINFFVATIKPQYEYLLQSDAAATAVNHFFDVALPLGGVISIPFTGLILDNTSTPFVLFLLTIMATAIGVFGVIPSMGAAYVNILLFVIYRPFYYTAVSDYAAKVFGFHTFGKVYGLTICLAGLLNFSQSALDALMHRGFDGNPVPVNIILLLLALVVGLTLVGYVWYKSRTIARDHLEEEAEGAAETLIPNGNG